jgi:hypothetical protein
MLKKIVLIVVFFSSCSLFEKEDLEINFCPNNECWVRLYTDFEPDENGYHHVTPFWFSPTSGRFNIHIESSPTLPNCQYGGVPVVTSKFDSNTYWEVESGLSFTFSLYNPFKGYYNQQGNPIKIKDTIVTLDYFRGEIIPVIQNTTIVHDVLDKFECYGWTNPKSGPTPLETGNCVLYSKRIVGALIQKRLGDTLPIYSEANFDCGGLEVVKDSILVILE